MTNDIFTRLDFQKSPTPTGFKEKVQHVWYLYRNRKDFVELRLAESQNLLVPTSWYAATKHLKAFSKSDTLHLSDQTVICVSSAKKQATRISLSALGNYKVSRAVAARQIKTDIQQPAVLSADTSADYAWMVESFAPNSTQISQDTYMHTVLSSYARHAKGSILSFDAATQDLQEIIALLPSAIQQRLHSLAQIAAARYGKRNMIIRSNIHGDLTPSNIRISDQGLVLIDWDRAGLWPPELDIILYSADVRLRSSSADITYLDYIEEISNHHINKQQLKLMYQQFRSFKPNGKAYLQVYCIMLYRFVVLSVANIADTAQTDTIEAIIAAAERKLT